MKQEIDIPEGYEIDKQIIAYGQFDSENDALNKVIVYLKPKRRKLWSIIAENYGCPSDVDKGVIEAKQWLIERIKPIFKHYDKADEVILEDIKKEIGKK